MKFKIKVPGSCGEFVQGILNDEPFLITCPIDLFTTVTVSDLFRGQIGLGWKAKEMLKRTLKYLGREKMNFGIKLESELPHGKGMASSSADIAAVAKAVSFALREKLRAGEIAKLATSIEPTDGIFYNGIVAMNPVSGKVFHKFDFVPKYKIAVFDFGNKVNTLEFERRSNLHLANLPLFQKNSFQNIFDFVEISALANQKILYKDKLREIIHFARSLGALGVNIAHTGTVIGVFFDEDFFDVEACALKIEKNFPHIKFLMTTNLIDGGFKIIYCKE